MQQRPTSPGTGAIDMARLAALREREPTAWDKPRLHDESNGWKSLSGDLQLWDSEAPPGPTYVPPAQANIVVVSQMPARRIVTWMPSEGLKARSLGAHEVMVLPAGEPMYLEIDGPHRALVIRLQPRTLCDCLAPGGDISPKRVALRAASGHTDEVIRGLAQAMAESARDGAPHSSAFLQAGAAALATHLLGRYMQQPEEVVGRLGRSALRLVQDLMTARLHERLSVAELAAAAGYSVYHFGQLFKAATGMPPLRYLLKLRMDRARALVETTRMSLTEIGAEVGLDNPSHFSRTFRAYWGTTPSALRR